MPLTSTSDITLAFVLLFTESCNVRSHAPYERYLFR